MMGNFIELDGKDYCVIDRVNYNSNYYLYVVRVEGNIKEFSILKEKNENGNVFVESVKDENIIKEVLSRVSIENI